MSVFILGLNRSKATPRWFALRALARRLEVGGGDSNRDPRGHPPVRRRLGQERGTERSRRQGQRDDPEVCDAGATGQSWSHGLVQEVLSLAFDFLLSVKSCFFALLACH